jgi:hypothetical protein
MPTEAIIERAVDPHLPAPNHRKVAKVLLADSDLASRLTLKSLLGKAGYAVDGAASAAEAVCKLDAHEFQLVLADLRSEYEDAGPSLLLCASEGISAGYSPYQLGYEGTGVEQAGHGGFRPGCSHEQ